MEAQGRRTPPPRPVVPGHAGWASEPLRLLAAREASVLASLAKSLGFKATQNGRALTAVSALSPRLFLAGRPRPEARRLLCAVVPTGAPPGASARLLDA